MATEKRLIDANALTRRFKVRGCFKKDMLGCMVAKIINTAPTVDAVEVVRCKDCKWYRPPFCLLNDNKHGWLNHELPNHFCSHGERKSDGK